MTSRHQRWTSFPTDTQVTLIEDDLDALDKHIGEESAAVATRFSELEQDLKTIRNLLIGILVSVTTASIMFTVNIVIGTLHR